FGGAMDAFFTKLNTAGSALLYSTFLGGSGPQLGSALFPYTTLFRSVVGNTFSSNFPTTAGAFQTTLGGANDAFVTKLNAAGSALLYSTYLGGDNVDLGGLGIAVDTSGNAYVVGATQSSNFPTTPDAFQQTFGGFVDAFVSKLNAAGSALLYSTYLGGSSGDLGQNLAVDASGNAYVTGFTESPSNFPTTPGAYH